MTENISEYDIVEVVELNPEVPEACIGDRGTVLMIHLNSGVAEAFEIECVSPDGTNKWLGTFLLTHIMLVQKA